MRFPSPGALDGCKSKVKTVASLTRLTFKYAGSDKMVLNDVSCKLGQTSRVALVGANGAGKSTLLRLLVGDMSVTPQLGDRDMRATYLATPLTPHGPDIETKPPSPGVRDAPPPRAAPDNASNAGQVFRHRNLRVGLMYVCMYVCMYVSYVHMYVCMYHTSIFVPTICVLRHRLHTGYIAQHSMHHLEEHMSLTPISYIQMRFFNGRDKETEVMTLSTHST